MAEQHTPIERRLAAILAADVVGYSKLMSRDEETTLKHMMTVQDEIVLQQVVEFGGRLVKTTGDGFLIEFGSVVNAVHCAMEIQRKLCQYNEDFGPEQAIVFRIGVNIGDVMVREDDIFGDGVNVASRLEAISEPGGICVSEDVYRQCRGKTNIGFVDRGEVSLKNIDYPVRVWSVGNSQQETTPSLPAKWRDEFDEIERQPAVAVLPFNNMGNDPEQEYLVDGVTEDVITGLYSWRSFPVIARNSVFTYKGRAVDVKQVGRELGVRYVLEGSVRTSGNRVRVSAQLIDAATGHHIWAERYDRQLTEIFDLQDEITERITTTIAPELQRAEHNRVAQKEPANLTAWDLTLQAQFELEKVEADGHLKAKELLAAALEADPTAGRTLTLAARCHMEDIICGWSAEPARSCETALAFAEEAVRQDDTDFMAHNILAMTLLIARQHDRADAEMQQAKSLNPAFAMNYLGHAMIHCLSGTLDEVEPNIDVALRLSPHDPLKTFMLSHVSLARLLGHQFEDALDWADRAINENANNWMAHQYRAAALGLMGGTSRAQGALSMATALRPALSAQYVRDAFAFKYPEHAKLLIEGLSQAGMTAWLRRVGDPGRRRGRDERTGDLGHPAADQTRAGEQHSC